MDNFIFNFFHWVATPNLNATLLVLDILSTLFVFVILGVTLLIVITYYRDKFQTESALKANFPLWVRARYWSESFGKFVRAWVLSGDREELPFNRAQRAWVYKAAKGLSTYLSFGSSRKMDTPGTILIVPSAFPILPAERVAVPAPIIGVGCPQPYQPSSFFHISGMSFGAISKNAVLALSKGANLSKCWLNTGEGGLSDYHLQGGGDIVFQIGTANFGVRDANGDLDYGKLQAIAQNPQVKMIEIKISQGAKPGLGGVLPRHKITPEIAKVREIPMDKDCISPARHKSVKNYDDLLNMIERVRGVCAKPVGIKMVMGDEYFIRDLCVAILNRGVDMAPDFIFLDSGDGGSGAAPQSLMDFAGLYIRESLPIASLTLNHFGLKDRIKLIAAGKLINPDDVAYAMALGADFVVSARGFMFALGCIQAMACAENNCPTGIATQDYNRYRALNPTDKGVRVHNYHRALTDEVEKIAMACGVSSPWQLNVNHIRIVAESLHTVPFKKWFRADEFKAMF